MLEDQLLVVQKIFFSGKNMIRIRSSNTLKSFLNSVKLIPSFKVLWMLSLSKITSEQWQFVVSMEKQGTSVKERRPLAHGNHVLAQTGKMGSQIQKQRQFLIRD